MSAALGILCTVEGGVARVTLARPEIHNAFDPQMIAELTRLFVSLGDDVAVRAILLTGEGRSFCAGADLQWMKSLAAANEDENTADAKRLAALFRAVGDNPKPLVTLVNGSALGGGCGLVCCADVVIAGPQALFGFTEVRLGILPAVISPYILRRIGFAAASRYTLTGERFGPEEALKIGLINSICEEEGLAPEVQRVLGALLKGSSEAQAATKGLLRQILEIQDREKIENVTARAIAAQRVSSEGQEGMDAFFAKRPPRWASS